MLRLMPRHPIVHDFPMGFVNQDTYHRTAVGRSNSAYLLVAPALRYGGSSSLVDKAFNTQVVKCQVAAFVV